MEKTKLTLQSVQKILNNELPEKTTDLKQLVEGEESQAFSFFHNRESYVIRINKSVEGFKKDKYAYDHFNSGKIPIPRVVKLGQINGQHYFCITEKISGTTLQDLDPESVKRLLEPTVYVLQSINNVDVSHTGGFGEFDSAGIGKFKTWRNFLLSILDRKYYNWQLVLSGSNQDIVTKLMDRFKSLVQYCPEERRLLHGDFGSNNVLAERNKITAILDWENALYGDPLFDIAGAYFWKTWLKCMELQSAYYEAHLSSMTNYHKRIVCYQLRAALSEIYDNVLDNHLETIEWVMKRSIEILNIRIN